MDFTGKRSESQEEASSLRDLWTKSNIDMEDVRNKKMGSKMTIRINQKFEEEDFIVIVWNLLKKVCFRTGMTIVAVYGKDEGETECRQNKEKHYLVKCLEEVRKKIAERNIEEQAGNLHKNPVYSFNLEEWILTQVKEKKKINPMMRKEHLCGRLAC